jgi:hypothetical protein
MALRHAILQLLFLAGVIFPVNAAMDHGFNSKMYFSQPPSICFVHALFVSGFKVTGNLSMKA